MFDEAINQFNKCLEKDRNDFDALLGYGKSNLY